jgi:hypothetical protein
MENVKGKFCGDQVVLLLGIFRRALHPAATRGHHCALLLPRGTLPPKKKFLLVIYDLRFIREPSKVS